MSLALDKNRDDNRTAFTCATCKRSWAPRTGTAFGTTWCDRFSWVGFDEVYCSERCAEIGRPSRDLLKLVMGDLLLRGIDWIYDEAHVVEGRAGWALDQLDRFRRGK